MHLLRRFSPGLTLVLLISAVADLLARHTGLPHYGLSTLTLALAVGMLLGNLYPHLSTGRFPPGLRVAQRHLLRAGVALYGFNLSLQQIVQIGGAGLTVDVLMVVSTLGLGWWVGTRLLGLDRETAVLTSAGSAICGAAAVVATVPVLRMDEARMVEKTSAAVAAVVLFGTLAMLLYPFLYAWFETSHASFGLYIGATVHEVAQVVAIGNLLGDDVARTAVVVKMIRVMLLVPFLLLVSALSRGKTGRSAITVPWFTLAFVLFAGLHSLAVIPDNVIQILRQTGTYMLTAAMGALGVETTLGRLRQTGMRPFLLGLILFVHLVVNGSLLSHWAARAN